jgi:hypothetical protein
MVMIFGGGLKIEGSLIVVEPTGHGTVLQWEGNS